MKDFTFRVEELIDKYIKKDSLVLDVGCGTGVHTSILKQKTKRITGLDLKNFVKKKFKSDFKFILGELQKSREYLSTPGAAVKMILEHLALVV